jgi:hypothetical protein
MKRFGSAAWNGNLREGKGLVSTDLTASSTPIPLEGRTAWLRSTAISITQ